MAAPTLAYFNDPLRHTHRRLGVSYAGRADAFDQSQLGHTLGECPGVKQGDGSAHGVTDETNARGAACAHNAIEIVNIVGKMIVTASADPAAVAVAAAVRRDDPWKIPLSCFHRGYKSAPTVREIEIAVHQHERFAAGLAPF